MQWVTSASLLFAWFPFRDETVGIVKNISLVTSHPPILAQCVKYESENIHTCSVLSLWVYLDSSFNKIWVIPCDSTFAMILPFTLQTACAHAGCIVFCRRHGRSLMERGLRTRARENYIHSKEKHHPQRISQLSDLWSCKDTWPRQVREFHYSLFSGGFVLWSMLVQGKSSLQKLCLKRTGFVSRDNS